MDSQIIEDQLLERTVRLQFVATHLVENARTGLAEMSDFNALPMASHRATPWAERLDQLGASLRVSLVGLMQEEEARTSALFIAENGYSGISTGPTFELPEVMGRSFAEWFNQIAQDLVGKLERGSIVDSGHGDTARHAASLSALFTPAIRAIEALIRTMVQAILNRVTRRAMERKFSNAGEYQWQQISVLDARTTAICRRYAFKIWDAEFRPVGHNLPYAGGVPRHWYCRSIIVPIFGEAKLDLTLESWMESAGRSRMEELFGKRRLALFERGLVGVGDLVRGKAD